MRKAETGTLSDVDDAIVELVDSLGVGNAVALVQARLKSRCTISHFVPHSNIS